MEKEELKRMAAVLQELGLSYTETVEVIQEMSKDVQNAKKLWRDGYKSKLIKIALTLITFPEPHPHKRNNWRRSSSGWADPEQNQKVNATCRRRLQNIPRREQGHTEDQTIQNIATSDLF